MAGILPSCYARGTWTKLGVPTSREDNDKKVQVYFNLRTLLQELSIPQFRKMLQNFITELESDVSRTPFSHYFKSYYAKRCEQWAYCYRAGTPVNTNMTIESFHRLLKVVYLDSKHNRRIDHLLSVLLKIARDKAFERLIKYKKGKLYHRISEMKKRHHAAVDLLVAEVHIDKVTDSKWQVPSQSLGGNRCYTVQKILDQRSCKIRCSECGVCTHLYNCACVDYAVHSTACKHIHAVHVSNQQISTTGPSQATEGALTAASQSEPIVHILDSKPSGSLTQLKKEFQTLLDKAETIVRETDSCDVLKSGLAHLRSSISIMSSLSSDTSASRKRLIPTINIPPNTNIQHQERFYSTKKKRLTGANQGLTKPTVMEIDKCVTSLVDESHPVEVCGVCLQQQIENVVLQMVLLPGYNVQLALCGYTVLVLTLVHLYRWTMTHPIHVLIVFIKINFLKLITCSYFQ